MAGAGRAVARATLMLCAEVRRKEAVALRKAAKRKGLLRKVLKVVAVEEEAKDRGDAAGAPPAKDACRSEEHLPRD